MKLPQVLYFKPSICTNFHFVLYLLSYVMFMCYIMKLELQMTIVTFQIRTWHKDK